MSLFEKSALFVATLGSLTVAAAPAHAEGNCTTIDVALMPALAADASNQFPMQIVAWIEDENGVYKDTVFITEAVGRYGIGNRPGRYDFNSGPRWPYGRRITTFPVWAHRHGLTFPDIVFQNGDEDNLSHPSMESTADPKYCAPLMREEPEWDTGTCASTGYTDKGTFSATSESRYPPRQDVIRMEYDDAAVEMYDVMNPFDAVSQPTPPAGEIAKLLYAVPEQIGPGNYVMWVEVSKEFDMNGQYNPEVFPAPDVPWETYGLPYRGQPSVLYKVPFQLGATEATSASTMEYVGYGDPTGADGVVRPPDATITANTPGSGSSRLQLVSAGAEMYRVKVEAKPEQDFQAPAAPGDIVVADLTSTRATLAFTAPGDDGQTGGKVARYEVRMRAGEEITAENFEMSQLAAVMIVPEEGGLTQELVIERLLWETDYSVGIRAIDNCRNVGELAVMSFRTPERETGEVDACFIATAAYGSVLANDVEQLRSFRDVFLRRSVLGELATEAYYTFGPAVSGAIGESELMRHTTREALAPIVAAVKRILE